MPCFCLVNICLPKNFTFHTTSRYPIIAQVITNHITYRVCRSELNESEQVCRQLERKEDGLNSKDLETQVQPFVATYTSYKVIIESLIPAVMSLFVGAWSDKHGRKRVIFFAYSGIETSTCLVHNLQKLFTYVSHFRICRTIPYLLSAWINIYSDQGRVVSVGVIARRNDWWKLYSDCHADVLHYGCVDSGAASKAGGQLSSRSDLGSVFRYNLPF